MSHAFVLNNLVFRFDAEPNTKSRPILLEMSSKPSPEPVRAYKDMLGNQGMPLNCLDTCRQRSECLVFGCSRLVYEEFIEALSIATGLQKWRLRGEAPPKEQVPVTDWPNVESDMDAWRDWVRNGK